MYFKYLFSTTYEGIILFYFSCFKLYQLANPQVDTEKMVKKYVEFAKDSNNFFNYIKVPYILTPHKDLGFVAEIFKKNTKHIVKLFNQTMIDQSDLKDFNPVREVPIEKNTKELVIEKVQHCINQKPRNIGDLIYGYYLNYSQDITNKKDCMETFKKDIGEKCSDHHLLLPSRFTRKRRPKDINQLINKLRIVEVFYTDIKEEKILKQIENDLNLLSHQRT